MKLSTFSKAAQLAGVAGSKASPGSYAGEWTRRKRIEIRKWREILHSFFHSTCICQVPVTWDLRKEW